jgi:hypothetical protein
LPAGGHLSPRGRLSGCGRGLRHSPRDRPSDWTRTVCFLRYHPGLFPRSVVFLREIEHPIRFDQLVAEINPEVVNGGHRPAVGHDAVGTHEHEQVRRPLHLRVLASEVRPLPHDPALDLIADGQPVERNPPEGLAVGVEDQAVGGTLDVQGPAVVAKAAAVGDQRVCVLLPLPGGLEIGQGALDLVQVLGQPGQVGARDCHLLRALCHGRSPPVDLRLLFHQAGLLGLEPGAQVVRARAFLFDFDTHAPGPVLNGSHLGLECISFLHNLGVEGQPAALPFGLPGSGELGVLGLGLHHRLERLGSRHGLGPAVDDKQEQDQRSHGAQEHRQKRERRDLQYLPAAPHAAASLSVAGGRWLPAKRGPLASLLAPGHWPAVTTEAERAVKR